MKILRKLQTSLPLQPMPFSYLSPDTGLQHETKCKEFKISQRVPATKKIKGCPKSIVILNLFQHPLNPVMLNVVACNRFQHLSYRGDSGSGPEWRQQQVLN